MVEGHAVVLSQVAEYKETSKCGSFTTLSSSLGQILMQLHTGTAINIGPAMSKYVFSGSQHNCNYLANFYIIFFVYTGITLSPFVIIQGFVALVPNQINNY